MKTLLERFNEMAERSKAGKAERANDKKCCDAACATASVAFAELIQSVMESFIGVNDPKDMDAAIRAAATKLSERMVANATAPKASASDAKTVRDDVVAAVNDAIGTAVYESTDNDYRTERFVWYRVTRAGIINQFAYDKALLADIKIGKAIRLWAKCDYGAYTLYMGALNADNDDAFVDCIKQQVKDGTIPEQLGRVIFIMDILRKKITEMPVKTAAEAKATQNPPKKTDVVKAEEEAPVVEPEAVVAQA